jgi:hypothetical protein
LKLLSIRLRRMKTAFKPLLAAIPPGGQTMASWGQVLVGHPDEEKA